MGFEPMTLLWKSNILPAKLNEFKIITDYRVLSLLDFDKYTKTHTKYTVFFKTCIII